jgi:tetratricopeptide (TPR) repeat protein
MRLVVCAWFLTCGLGGDRQERLELARQALDKKDFARVISICSELIQDQPTDPKAYFLRADAYYWQRDYERSIADFTQIVRLEPKNAEGFFQRGICHAQKKDYDRAIADFTEAIRFEPKAFRGYRARGGAQAGKKEIGKAVADITRAIAFEPKLPELYLERAHYHKCQKQYRRALADYQTALDLDSGNPHVMNGLAWFLATCPDPGIRDGMRALKLAAKACDLTKRKDPYMCGTLAAALAETGDFVQAMEWLTRALKDSEFAESHGQQARRRMELYKNKKPYYEDE